MWNWLVSGLASRSTIVLFDGSPLTPDLKFFGIMQRSIVDAFRSKCSILFDSRESGLRATSKLRIEISAMRSLDRFAIATRVL